MKQPDFTFVPWETRPTGLGDGTTYIVPAGGPAPGVPWIPIAVAYRPDVAEWIVQLQNAQLVEELTGG